MQPNRWLLRAHYWFSILVVFSFLFTSVEGSELRPFEVASISPTAYLQEGPPQINVLASNANELVLEVSVPPVQIRQVVVNGVAYQRLYMPGTGSTAEIGKPELPAMGRFIVVPQGAKPHIEVLEEIPSTIPLERQGTYRVYPALQPQADGWPEPPFVLDKDFYEQAAFYPSATVMADETTTLRGVNVAAVRFFPVQFNPARGELRVFSKFRVRISFSGGSGQFADQRLWSPHFETMYQQLLLNYPRAKADADQAAPATRLSYLTQAANGAELLIVTHPNFVAQANTLANWKRRRGILTTVRTTAQTGTTADDIRNYILSAYTTWNPPPSFVLLLGDAEFLPTHYVTVHPWASSSNWWYPSGARIGTDLYYADMTGNYYPELAVGRLPVNTTDEAALVVNKIIDYERVPPSAGAFYSNAMIASYFQDDELDHYENRRFVETSEEVRDWMLAQGYSVDRVYYTESNVTPMYYNNGQYSDGGPLPSELLKPGFAWNGSSSMIKSVINAGRFLVIHRDHGESFNNGQFEGDGWLAPEFTVSDVGDLANGSKLPVVFSVNCETGWFDSETDFNSGANYQSLAEAFLLRAGGGAVGVVGASRISFSGYNDFMLRGFIDAIWPQFIPDWGGATPEYRLGNVLNTGKLGMAQFWGDPEGYLQIQFEMVNYLGDPTMEIWTGLPGALPVSHPATMPEASTSLTIDVPQDDALVSLVQNGDILARATSTGGHATLSFDPVSADLVYVTVTKHNYVPYEGTVTVLAAGTSTPTPSATWTPTGTLSPTATSTPVPSATPTATTLPTGKPVTITLQVSSSSDDANQDGSAVALASSTLWLGNGASATSSYTGLRFANLGIPPGAVIASAHLEVYSTQSAWIWLGMTLAAHASGNSPTFSSSAAPAQRTLTTHQVTHSSNALWLASTWYSLDELAPVVQEIVNRPDWQSGNSLSIIIKGTGSAWGRKFAGSYDRSPTTAPRLVITYQG